MLRLIALILFFFFLGGVQLVFHGFSYLASQASQDGMQDIIWAFSRTLPESADTDAEILVHHLFGSSVFNLRHPPTAVSEDDPAPSPVPSTEAGKDDRTCGRRPCACGTLHLGVPAGDPV